MAVSMKNLVQKETAKTVKKHVEIKPEQIFDLVKKAIGAPESIPVVEGDIAVKDEAGNVVGYTKGYVLDWTDNPKPRAPRKAKVAKPAAPEQA